MITLACLDMAGTTVRDDGLVDAAFAAAMDGIGLDPSALAAAREHVHRTMGLPKQVVFRHIVGDDDLAARCVELFDAAVLAEIEAGRVAPIDGAEAAFGQMRASGITVCLTTGFTEDVQTALIAALGWGDLIDLALCPGPGVRGRPFPDLVLRAALRSEVDDVRDIAVVGDTANDLLSGHRAGAGILVGVLSGSHGRDELEAGPHTHLIDSVRTLPDVLGLGA
jgi:phosphonatase-like hydrolase